MVIRIIVLTKVYKIERIRNEIFVVIIIDIKKAI